ncbi:DAK2 domain fusion protein YloV [Nocardioides massiliensis]|uniref:DAK2 domain fusion protein YloV n=2 Tax=Nocardioides massiliensis TaxID=1325935 RepID=A0ABT9NQ45_9ACTN|nr:DAK2 domain-containing protein [Nocardioides massiliensis]MDP9822552.1 DAK2 domain fusion protein YloV [Nocardioides massiliensis]
MDHDAPAPGVRASLPPVDQVGSLDLAVVTRFCDLAVDRLAEAREEIDALNVYPVPDGDTGTNMYLTFQAARDAMLAATGGDPDADLSTALTALGRGALLGARGNSGVILCQVIAAFAGRIAAAQVGDRTAEVFAEALVAATEASYAAVGDPVEGTILSVARAASDAARAVAAVPTTRLGHVIGAAATAAREALARTPEQLPVLRDAGVVDAGGRGLCVVLDAAESAITGKRAVGSTFRLGEPRRIPVPLPSGDLTAEGPAYEVMYLLDADDASIPELRRTLRSLGDSLVVVGGDGLWNVHVHVDDVGAAIEAGLVAGRPRRVKVTHFAEQIGRARAVVPTDRKGRKVVVVAAGPGLAELFAECGAVVVSGGPGRRPSTGDLLQAITGSGAAEVVVLPNDGDSVRVAEAAARTAETDHDVRVAVVPTTAQVQGLAALAVHEPGRSFEQDLVQMTASARHARHGAVTVAVKEAMTTAGACRPGDVLGAIEGDFVEVGADLYAVAVTVLERLLGGGGELVTIVAGVDGAELAGRCAAHLEATHPTVDVVVYEGGQERYPLLVAVE